MDNQKEVLTDEELKEIHGGSEIRKDVLRKYGEKINKKTKRIITDKGLEDTNVKC